MVVLVCPSCGSDELVRYGKRAGLFNQRYKCMHCRRITQNPTPRHFSDNPRTHHQRVDKARGQPKRCAVCGTRDLRKRYEWANLTGNYANVRDYKRMCSSCHAKFDGKARNLRPR